MSPQSNYGIFLILIRVLGLPQSIEINKRPDKKFRKALLGPLLFQWGVKTSNSFPRLLPEARASWCLLCGVSGCLARVAWLVYPPLCWCWAQMACVLLLTVCFCSWLFRSVIWIVLVFLCPVVHNLPQLCMHSFHFVLFFCCFFCWFSFSVPYTFFVFCCSSRHPSSCKHCSKES